MTPELSTPPPPMLRVKIRVKKWRAHSKGWTPLWRAIVSASALVSLVLALVFLYLLLRLFFAEQMSHIESSLNPVLQLPWLARHHGMTATAVPEPSRCILVLMAMVSAILRRRR